MLARGAREMARAVLRSCGLLVAAVGAAATNIAMRTEDVTFFLGQWWTRRFLLDPRKARYRDLCGLEPWSGDDRGDELLVRATLANHLNPSRSSARMTLPG